MPTILFVVPNFYCLNLKGSSIGVAFTYPVCGFILEKFGWPYVFYITGIIGIVWCLAWWLLVYDTPAQHPYISPGELAHITSSLSNMVSPVQVNLKDFSIDLYVGSFFLTAHCFFFLFYVCSYRYLGRMC